MYFVKIFLFFSMFGFFLEIMMKFLFHPSMNTGILHGPWIPIYGLGIVTTIVLCDLIARKIKKNIWLQALIMFIVMIVVISLLELSGGMFLEYTFDIVFWNHSHFALSIGNYIAVEMSIIWSLMLLIFYYGIRNKTDILLGKVPKQLALFIFLLFSIDVVFTFFV